MKAQRMIISLATPVLLGALFLPYWSTASTVGYEPEYPFIGNWEHPLGTELLEEGDPVFVGATYQLPPNWVMNVYFYFDGTEDPAYIAISNRGRTATRTGTFSGTYAKALSRGTHTVRMAVYAADVCLFDKVAPCKKDLTTYRPNIVYQQREFPVYPIYDKGGGSAER